MKLLEQVVGIAVGRRLVGGLAMTLVERYFHIFHSIIPFFSITTYSYRMDFRPFMGPLAVFFDFAGNVVFQMVSESPFCCKAEILLLSVTDNFS